MAIGAINDAGLLAAICFEGTCNTDVFVHFLERELLPKIRQGHCLVMDNDTVHKNERVQSVGERHGIQIIYLPPYSPEMNPIEYCWANVKRFIRKIKPRGLDQLYQASEKGLKLIDSEMTSQCMRHSSFVSN